MQAQEDRTAAPEAHLPSEAGRGLESVEAWDEILNSARGEYGLEPVYEDHDRERIHGSGEDHRPPFLRDFDRLVHRPAFRRLQGKTQVVTPGQADFFRTRLTHTLEVVQISRDIAHRLFLRENANQEREELPLPWQQLATAVQASAVLHDLGHPPFGHSGEEALLDALSTVAKWDSQRLGGFEGNAQSIHMAVAALTRSANYRGLDLTRTVLDGAVKYPWERFGAGRRSQRKWCFYPSTRTDAAWIRENVPAGREHLKSLEAEVVEWADDVAYVIHDIEDWYKAGFVPLHQLGDDNLREELVPLTLNSLASEEIRPDGVDLPAVVQECVEGLNGRGRDGLIDIAHGYDGSDGCKDEIRRMRDALFGRFLQAVSLSDVAQPASRHHNSLDIALEVRVQVHALKALIYRYVIQDLRMGTAEAGHQRIVHDLVDIHAGEALGDTGHGLRVFPEDTRQRLTTLREAGDRVAMLRTVSDYVAGMTDAYAIKVHGRLTGTEPGIFNEFM